jgi:hypothetical protein
MKTAAMIAGAFACTMLAGPVAADQFQISPRTLQPIAASGELIMPTSGPGLVRLDAKVDSAAVLTAVLRNAPAKPGDCRAASGFSSERCLAAQSAAYW